MLNKIAKGVVATAFAAVLSTGLQATEGGGGAYPNGSEGFMAGAVPPPGLYYLNYLTNYSADALMDNNGNEVGDFKLNATANVSRFVYTSPYKIFGGYWGAQLIIPLVTLDAKLSINPGPGTVLDGSDTGLGDIVVDPFLVSWHSKNWHQAVGVDIILPTGSYSTPSATNIGPSIGRNYYTFEPLYAVTYISDEGWEVSSKIMYDFNRENSDTNYKSGEEFHFDYTVGKHINKDWTVGVGGYYYKQITDDEQNGATIANNKGQVIAVGPQVQYNYGKLSLIAKYHIETNVKNRPKGNKAWFKLIYPL
ncbi:transporter [Sulfurimonas sp.]|uniref:SphA family protein n=1 Tax=Sulfurimonas sp. TaxID=2022749 RepID=UPI0039E714BF